MKPFDLGAALAGKKVVTRDGRTVTQVTKFDISNRFSVRAVIGGTIFSFTSAGEFVIGGDEGLDLFMASETKTVWVNLYPSYHGQQVPRYFEHTSQSSADLANTSASYERLGNKAFEITYEV
jgi:hypothetical protein